MQMNTFGPVGTPFLGNVHVFQGGVLSEIERQCRTMPGKRPTAVPPHQTHTHTQTRTLTQCIKTNTICLC